MSTRGSRCHSTLLQFHPRAVPFFIASRPRHAAGASACEPAPTPSGDREQMEGVSAEFSPRTLPACWSTEDVLDTIAVLSTMNCNPANAGAASSGNRPYLARGRPSPYETPPGCLDQAQRPSGNQDSVPRTQPAGQSRKFCIGIRSKAMADSPGCTRLWGDIGRSSMPLIS